jgi:hypothetical protein
MVMPGGYRRFYRTVRSTRPCWLRRLHSPVSQAWKGLLAAGGLGQVEALITGIIVSNAPQPRSLR